ncbi:Hypothetical_protein [Hexamita inflata]|uniref:Hypothetical_protein n=1 Tax=Hexamita inflata TaxID=28002 RepID=A0ABP1H6E2_9EUKA
MNSQKLSGLETILECEDDPSDAGEMTSFSDSKLPNRSVCANIQTVDIQKFACLSRQEFYDLSCTLEYLEMCHDDVVSRMGAFGRKLLKCRKTLTSSQKK